MKYILIILIVFVNCIKSFGQTDLDMEIISDLIKNFFVQKSNDTIFTQKGKIKRIKTFSNNIILVTETDASYRSKVPFEYLTKNMNKIDSNSYQDFLLKNRFIIKIDSIHGFNGTITYLKNSEIKQIFEKGSWKAYHKIYGYDPIVRISRPGINSEKNIAFIYFSMINSGLSGIGLFLILEKINNVWVSKEVELAWES